MKSKIMKFGIAVAAIVLGFALLLWSWNTLAELFGLPAAEARHALAALLIIGMLRYVTGNRRHGTKQPGLRHGH